MRESKEQTYGGLSFDDILLVPGESSVESRADVSLQTNINGIAMKTPIIASPMDTVCGGVMAASIGLAGGLGYIHRYMTLPQQCREVDYAKNFNVKVGAAIGAKGEFLRHAEELIGFGADSILVDTANGHSTYTRAAIRDLRREFPDAHIVAGNVATGEGFLRLSEAGANAVRVGIGGGSVCTTREVTGHGVPTLASIMSCYETKRLEGVHTAIIADGGIRKPADVVKALAAGANAVMLGSMLAGTHQAPGVRTTDGKKEYRGMASARAQESFYGKGKVRAEGASTTIPVTGPVSEVMKEILDGVSSGCSYTGVHTLYGLRLASQYVVVSHSAQAENKPHAVTL